MRARESARADALFSDPWAKLLAGKEGEQWRDNFSTGGVRGADDLLAIRTRYFDDRVIEGTGSGIQQIVLVAAGMDVRAFRLRLSTDVQVFELDQGDVLELKNDLLSDAGARPVCHRSTIPVDLSETFTDALRGAGFDASRRSLWLLEGLLFYLTEPVADALLDRVAAELAPGSTVLFDLINPAMLESSYTRTWIDKLVEAGVPWHFACDDPEALAARRGWRARVVQPGEATANFGRWQLPVFPRGAPAVPRTFFVVATTEAA